MSAGDNLRLNSLRRALVARRNGTSLPGCAVARGRGDRASVSLSCGYPVFFWARVFWARVFHFLRAPRVSLGISTTTSPTNGPSFSFFHKPHSSARCLGKYTHTGFQSCLRDDAVPDAQRALVNTLPLERLVGEDGRQRRQATCNARLSTCRP